MPYGVNGRILKINLTKHKYEITEIPYHLYEWWYGGYGLGAWLLYNEIPKGADPLGPENVLGFMTGILTGLPAPFSGSFHVIGKSPITGGFGDSRGGGYLGPEIKHAGFDGILIYGRSENPVYVWISDDNIEFRDASQTWGETVKTTEATIADEIGDKKVKIASIGPAGEKRSLIAGIVTDGGRIAARSGLGAVMGSKNLKAIVIRGSKEINVKDYDKLVELTREFIKKGKEHDSWKMLSTYGTSGGTAFNVNIGDAPVKNWGGTPDDFPNAEKISDEAVRQIQKRKYACAGCPVGCGGIVEVSHKTGAIVSHKPEYETLAAFGSNCLNDDLASIVRINEICNEYGLDTISAGSTLAFALELYEVGIITKEDLGGLELTWDNNDAKEEMVLLMAKREGFGAILADGSKFAADKIGKGSEKYAMHVGGQDLPMHDPRIGPGHGVTYTSNATPARHTQGSIGYAETYGSPLFLPGVGSFDVGDKMNPHGKAKLQWLVTNYEHAFHSLGICNFWSWAAGIPDVPTPMQFIEAVTGWDVPPDKFIHIGNRIGTLRWVFNLREGLKPNDFKLPDRILGKPPMKRGPHKDLVLEEHINIRRKEYFEYEQWDPVTGIPSAQRLFQLGLDFVIKDFTKNNQKN